jgi:hypothetical protein
LVSEVKREVEEVKEHATATISKSVNTLSGGCQKTKISEKPYLYSEKKKKCGDDELQSLRICEI